MVRRVEPGLVTPASPRSLARAEEEDLLQLNPDLRDVRDLILSEDADPEAGPRLTDLLGRGAGAGARQLRRHGSYGSLVSPSMPPAMPLMPAWAPPPYPHPPPHHGDTLGGWPPYYDPYYGPYPPPHLLHYPKVSRRQQRRGRHERELSSEGENTSNDACDLSSSEASGSGRRGRKNKSMSPKPPLVARPHKPGTKSRKSHSQSPRCRVEADKGGHSTNPMKLKTSAPDPDRSRHKADSFKDKNLSDNLGNDAADNDNTESPLPAPETNKVEDYSSKAGDRLIENPHDKDLRPQDDNEDNEAQPPQPRPPPRRSPVRTQSQLELKRMESEQKFVLESGDDEAKLYSSETEESSARDAEDLASKKTSVDRERKVGVGVGVAQQQPEQPPPQQSSAYQQLLLGGQKQPPVPTAEEDTSEDDIEAQLALPAAVARPRPGLRPGAGASSLHNMDEDESFGHPAPGTHHQPASQVRYIIYIERQVSIYNLLTGPETRGASATVRAGRPPHAPQLRAARPRSLRRGPRRPGWRPPGPPPGAEGGADGRGERGHGPARGGHGARVRTRQ